MNAPAGLRFQPFALRTYAAFRADDSGTSRLNIGEPDSLADAIAAASPALLHRDCLVIRETDDDGATKLHVFTIRRKAAKWVYAYPGDPLPTRISDCYADPVVTLSGEVLAIARAEAEGEG